MALEELIQTLKKNQQKQIEAIWQQARGEAESIHNRVAEAIAERTQEHKDQLAAACRRSASAILAESEKMVRVKKLSVYQRLDETLYRTAVKQLPKLRLTDYGKIFAGLVNELPALQWGKIIVNPADTELASGYFNREIITPDAEVTGGLIAVNADGRIVVNNSFEKRLERIWPLILPELIQNMEQLYDKFQSVEKD